MAEGLENAGNGHNLAYIEEYTKELLTKYRALGEKLSLLESSKDCLPKLEKNARINALETMIEIAETEDYDFLDNLLSDLRRFGLTQKDETFIDEVEDLLFGQDWEEIKQKATRALEIVKER